MTRARKKKPQIAPDGALEVVQQVEQPDLDFSEPEENPEDKPHPEKRSKKNHPSRTSEESSIESLSTDFSAMGGFFPSQSATPVPSMDYSSPGTSSAIHPGNPRPPFFIPVCRPKITQEPRDIPHSNTGIIAEEPSGSQLNSAQGTGAVVPFNFPFDFGATNYNNGQHSLVSRDGSQVGGPNGQYFTMTSKYNFREWQSSHVCCVVNGLLFRTIQVL